MTRRRRVLFCAQTAYTGGGTEAWLDRIVCLLAGSGWECMVGLARGRRFHDPTAYRRAHPNLETVELDGRMGTRELRVAALRKALVQTQPDLVVPVGLADPLEAVARAKLAGSPVRLLAALHGLSAGVIGDLRRYRAFIDVAVGVNRLLTRLLIDPVGIPHERARYVPHAYARPAPSVRAAGSRQIRLGYVGRLDQVEKRVLDLITLARALDARGVDYVLEVAGDGPCRDQLGRDLPGPRTRFLGFVPSDVLHESVYPRLDCLLLLSPAEGGPHVLVEAMHHGVVPVSSRFMGHRAEQLLHDGRTALLFDVGDVDTAADHVTRVHADRTLLAALGARCRSAVEARFDLGPWRAAWLAAFAAAADGPCARGVGLPDRASRPAGRLESWGIPSAVASRLRLVLGRVPDVDDPGAEWPHCGTFTPEEQEQIEAAAHRLDAPEPGAPAPS